MDAAGGHTEVESLAQGGGNLDKRPAALPQAADQPGVRFKFTGGRVGLSLREERGDFVFKAHAHAGSSTSERIRARFEGIRGYFSGWAVGHRTGLKIIEWRAMAFEAIRAFLEDAIYR
jgi:hypothetical protein